MRFFWKMTFSVCLLVLLPCSVVMSQERVSETSAEVVIYGGTPSGIAAAISAARSGHSVILLEPYSRIGGLVTNGLSHTDFRTFEGISGTFLDLNRRVEAYYEKKYGRGNEAGDSFRGTHGEPHVNLLVFEQMLAEFPKIQVLTKHKLQTAEKSSADTAERIRLLKVVNRDGDLVTVTGQVFIDASYEGDLLAASGIAYHVGREASSEYGESLAPETADREVQGYNFRLMMTQGPENRVSAFEPAGYRREDYLPLLELFEKKKLQSVFCAPKGGIYKYQPPRLPGNKYDINDVSRGVVRLSIPQISGGWPDGDEAAREEIFRKHVQHQVGMLYFLQTDSEVPESIREEACSWGFCRDEFQEHRHIPEQLYVREARRMIGKYIFTENDTNYAPGDARAVLQGESIAIGDYGLNCHGTNHEGPFLGGSHTGEFYRGVAPYQIPYGVLVPKNCENLLVSVACSASHVGFCALRLEPIWTSLGQASGVAAGLAIKEQIPVQNVTVKKIQNQLHQQGSATIYFSDVLPGNADYEAVQWWGTLGGFHGLEPAPKRLGQRGENILGQYYQAYPGHAAGLDVPLTEELKSRWSRLAESNGIVLPDQTMKTRGDFIRALHANRTAL